MPQSSPLVPVSLPTGFAIIWTNNTRIRWLIGPKLERNIFHTFPRVPVTLQAVAPCCNFFYSGLKKKIVSQSSTVLIKGIPVHWSKCALQQEPSREGESWCTGVSVPFSKNQAEAGGRRGYHGALVQVFPGHSFPSTFITSPSFCFSKLTQFFFAKSIL